jgi:syntenin-1
MSIYPSLEDMKATEMIHAQIGAMQQENHYPSAPVPTLNRGYPTNGSYGGHTASSAYPSLQDFMGLELTEDMIRANMPEYLNQPTNNQSAHYGTVAVPQAATMVPARTNAGVGIIAPISGSPAVIKSMVTHGVRHVTLTKDESKIGLRVRAMNTGVFVCLVIDGSPAAKSGLRFGDQILQIDGQDMAGLSVDKVHSIFKKKNVGQSFLLAVRDRPFERTVTLVRDSLGSIGFQFRDGKIVNIVKDSSAARNGLLTDHNLLEINGKNVIGMKDKEITKVIGSMEGNALTVTVMPTFLYTHMVKEMAGSLFGKMDHSTPDF